MRGLLYVARDFLTLRLQRSLDPVAGSCTRMLTGAAHRSPPARAGLLPTFAGLALALVLVGCGPTQSERSAAQRNYRPPPLVLVPLSDGKMAKQTVLPGSGALLTAEVERALRSKGVDVVVAASASAEDVRAAVGESRGLLICGNFMEWEPDMAVALVAVSVDGEPLAHSHAVAQYGPRMRQTKRRGMLPHLAEQVVAELINEMRRGEWRKAGR